MSKENQLRELETIAKNTNLPLERRIVDMAVWFHRNKDRIPREALDKRVDFLEKSLDISLELIAMLAERLQHAEGRSKLYLPRGLDVRGDLTKFG